MKRQAGREVCRLLAWVCLEGDEKQAGKEVCRLLAWVCLEGDEKQVVGVGMLRGLQVVGVGIEGDGRQAGRFAGCWRGYA